MDVNGCKCKEWEASYWMYGMVRNCKEWVYIGWNIRFHYLTFILSERFLTFSWRRRSITTTRWQHVTPTRWNCLSSVLVWQLLLSEDRCWQEHLVTCNVVCTLCLPLYYHMLYHISWEDVLSASVSLTYLSGRETLSCQGVRVALSSLDAPLLF